MIRCPECGGGRLHCLQTVTQQPSRAHIQASSTATYLDSDIVKRRRQCRDCGHRMNTIEVPADIMSRLLTLFRIHLNEE